MIVRVKGRTCQFDGCERDATTIAAGREPVIHVGVFCDTHAEVVADEGSPEYTYYCANCGCLQGVN